MTGRVFSVVIGVVAVIILALTLPSIPTAVEDFRTETLSQSYSVTTGVGVTIGSVPLASSLWNDSVAYVTNISSNITGDSPLADNYTAASRTVGITGLSANTTRSLTVSYRTGGLSANPAADSGITFLPSVIVGLIILIPLVLLASLIGGK